MAQRKSMTEEDTLVILYCSTDDEISDDDDADIFEPDISENLSSSDGGNELSSFDEGEDTDNGEEEMEVDQENDSLSTSAASNTGNNISSASASCTQSIWKTYTSIDADLIKIPFTVSNPGINLPNEGTYDNELAFFQLFFSDNVISEIVQETNRYAKEKIQKSLPLPKRSIWNNWNDTTLEEMKAILGVVLNMGLNPKCEMKEYFSKQWLDKMPFFVETFSRNRFFQLYWMLHLQQSIGQGFRGDKVKNLVDHINSKCLEYFVPNEHISVDESTIGFKGRVMWKCYNPNKPTKWGLRVYTMCDSASAYITAFVPYYGKSTTASLVRPDLPFTSRIVLQLCDMLSSSVNETGYHIYTDRFYTSPTLCEELRKKSFHLTGTVLPRRKGMPQDFRKKKQKPKLHEVIAFRQNDDTMALQWKDKRVITMLSTMYNTQCEDVVRTMGPNTATTISKPVVISQYTKFMGGVDRADHYCGSYAFLRKTSKWWRKMFFWLLEVAIVNSYILFNLNRKQQGLKEVRHKKFRKSLILQLVGNVRNKNANKCRGRIVDVEGCDRLTGKHFVDKIPNGKAKDCAVCSDRKVKRIQTVYHCETCERKPGLHPGICFKKYHTEKKYK